NVTPHHSTSFGKNCSQNCSQRTSLDQARATGVPSRGYRIANARYLSSPRFANHQTTREATGWNRTRSSLSGDTKSEALLQFAAVRPLWVAIPALTEDATPLRTAKRPLCPPGYWTSPLWRAFRRRPACPHFPGHARHSTKNAYDSFQDGSRNVEHLWHE